MTAAISELCNLIKAGLTKSSKPVLFVGDVNHESLHYGLALLDIKFSSIGMMAASLEEDCIELDLVGTNNTIMFLYRGDIINDSAVIKKNIEDKLGEGIPKNNVLVMTAQNLDKVKLNLDIFDIIIN